MTETSMDVHEAQKQARQMSRFFRAFKDLNLVLDAVVDAEDHISHAKLEVSNSHEHMKVLLAEKSALEDDITAYTAQKEDMHRQAKTLAVTLSAYQEQVETKIGELDSIYEKAAEKHDKAVSQLTVIKTDLVEQVKALQAEKDQIESVVEAFRKANQTSGS